MRWDNLTPSVQDVPLGVGEVVAGTFGTCLLGDTPILMADGRTVALAEAGVGDAIYGTVQDGGAPRFTLTEVLAHWETFTPAHRVILADGTDLVAGGDHRFLTDLGCKHMTGGTDRPTLVVGDWMIGTGRFAEAPPDSADYRRGYLCGILRGDPRRVLGLVDREVLRRVGGYFMDAGTRSREAQLQSVVSSARTARSTMRDQMRAGFDVIAEMTSWPGELTGEWYRGVLAGIFDAEGSCSRGGLRLVAHGPAVTESVLSGLARFGFPATAEQPGWPAGSRCVRLLGAVGEQLRFLRTVDPATSRKRSIAGMAIRQGVRVVSVEDLGVPLPMCGITTGTGDCIANGMVSIGAPGTATDRFPAPGGGWNGRGRGTISLCRVP